MEFPCLLCRFSQYVSHRCFCFSSYSRWWILNCDEFLHLGTFVSWIGCFWKTISLEGSSLSVSNFGSCLGNSCNWPELWCCSWTLVPLFVFKCLTYCSFLPHQNSLRFDPERATSLAFLVINELVEVSALFSLLWWILFHFDYMVYSGLKLNKADMNLCMVLKPLLNCTQEKNVQ